MHRHCVIVTDISLKCTLPRILFLAKVESLIQRTSYGDVLLPMDSPSGLMTAGEATSRLCVNRRTLYAYVSRGLIRSVPHPNNPRLCLYVRADVEERVRQKALTRGPAAAAAAALNFGLPIMRTRISSVSGHRLLYRGHDAVALAEGRSLEEVARVLWEVDHDPFAEVRFLPWRENSWARIAKLVEATAPIDRALILLPLLAITSVTFGEMPPVETAVRVLLAIANAAAGRALEPGMALHRALASAWGTPVAGDIIRRALVLAAEHELDPSTFAVRVVASTGAALPTALLAGLAALGGPRLGGQRPPWRAIYGDWLRGAEAGVLDQGSSTRPCAPPGFGHPLYPDGDPRAAALLKHLDMTSTTRRLVTAIEAKTGLRPNILGALWMIERRFKLPKGAALALFAIGRSVGWIAHALEQRDSDAVIRPRAAPIKAQLDQGDAE